MSIRFKSVYFFVCLAAVWLIRNEMWGKEVEQRSLGTFLSKSNEKVLGVLIIQYDIRTNIHLLHRLQ